MKPQQRPAPSEETRHDSSASRLRAWSRTIAAGVQPSPRAWRGAAVALLSVALLVWGWATVPQLAPFFQPFALLIAGTNLLLAPLLAGLLLLILGRLFALPRLFRWTLLSVVVLLGTLGAGPSLRGWIITLALLVVTVAIIGGVSWSFVGGGWGRMAWPRRLLTLTGLVLSLAVLAGGASWLLGPGPAARSDAAQDEIRITPLSQPDPAQPGPYPIEILTYGSGQDRLRPEYGADVNVTTTSVDASAIVHGWSGMSGAARTSLWGFDAHALPINGRVWSPQGPGPFPLVLIVHGNSRPEDFSDRGFAYLGELLSSRGFIVASVDENFLNTGLLDRMGGLTGVDAARGWLLLEHLRVWTTWNAQPDSRFYQKIDTTNIALIGHSRGGEAVAVAAFFNRLDRFPDNPTLRFDYGYDIRSVIALAPSDALYRPLGQKVPLENINYLALQGSHDADVISFAALNQYHRVTFNTDQPWLKAALYIDRANHSQFNTVWDQFDVGQGLSARFINTAALIPAAEQREIAQVTISAFLETTLRGESAYRPFFRDPRLGALWLPKTVYLEQYADAETQYISTFDEDVNLVSTTLAGGSQEGVGLAQWTEEPLPLRLGAADNRAVRLAWSRQQGAEAPRYTISLPAERITLAGEPALRVNIADGGAALVAGNAPTNDAAALVNLTIEGRDTDGDSARLSLRQFSSLQPQIKGQYLKHAFLHDTPLSEPIFQTFNLPLADFRAFNPAFNPESLAAISFVFDETAAGMILLDDIGIAPSAPE